MSMSVRNLAVSLVVGFLWIGASTVSAQTKSPTAEVTDAVNEVLGYLGDANLDPAKRYELIRAGLVPRFDFRGMARSVLGKNWKKATPQEQERFVELFQKLLGNVYITAMEGYTGETVRYGKERVEGKRAMVNTYIVRTTSGEIPVSYRLRVRDERWRAYDVTVEGVSIVSNYRSTFNSIVRKKGVSGLIEQLEKKLSTDA